MSCPAPCFALTAVSALSCYVMRRQQEDRVTWQYLNPCCVLQAQSRSMKLMETSVCIACSNLHSPLPSGYLSLHPAEQRAGNWRPKGWLVLYHKPWLRWNQNSRVLLSFIFYCSLRLWVSHFENTLSGKKVVLRNSGDDILSFGAVVDHLSKPK